MSCLRSGEVPDLIRTRAVESRISRSCVGTFVIHISSNHWNVGYFALLEQLGDGVRKRQTINCWQKGG